MTARDDAADATVGELEMARALLARLGVRPEELLGTPTGVPLSSRSFQLPTFAEYIARVSAVVTPGTRRVYDSYWRRIRQDWGERTLDEPTPLEIKEFAERVKATAVVRSHSRGGRTAAEHLISAMRCLYRHAVTDRLRVGSPMLTAHTDLLILQPTAGSHA